MTSSARWLARIHVSGPPEQQSFLHFVVFPLRTDNFTIAVNAGGR
jgi:hypothetical protein